MRTTNNLGLKKPEGTDIVDIADLNGNMDTLDSAVKSLQDQVAASVPLTQKGAANGVATLDASAKLPAGQLPATTVQATTADVTYYVRTDGNDSNNGLANTAAGAFRTIDKALSMVPKIINHNVNIIVAAGTYTENLSILGFSGAGTITVTGDSVLSTTRTVNRIIIANCSLIATATGFNCSTTTMDPVTLQANNGAVVYNITATTVPSPAGSTIGIIVNLGTARISTCMISNKGRAISIVNGGSAYVENISGSGNSFSYVADLGGRISWAGTKASSINGDIAINGGIVNHDVLNPWGDNTTTRRSAASATANGTQTFTPNTWTKIVAPFAGENFDYLGEYDQTTATFTAKQNGIYHAVLQVLFTGGDLSSSMDMEVRMYKGSNPDQTLGKARFNTNNDPIFHGSLITDVNAGTALTFYLNHTHSSSRTSSADGYWCYLKIVRIA